MVSGELEDDDEEEDEVDKLEEDDELVVTLLLVVLVVDFWLARIAYAPPTTIITITTITATITVVEIPRREFTCIRNA